MQYASAPQTCQDPQLLLVPGGGSRSVRVEIGLLAAELYPLSKCTEMRSALK
jgi:hypothetical protein